MISLHIAMRIPRWLVVAAAAASLALTLPFASMADEAKPSSPMTHYESPKAATQESDAKTAGQPDAAAKAPEFSAHGTFSSICGFCHEDGGRRAGKGPQLMGTEKTDEQIFERIKFGKPGRMAAFGGAFTDDQIRQIVVYIRHLKPR
jgi:mono/diheme cytochrome c family protein